MFGKGKDDRFKVIYEQGKVNRFKVFQDTETGVNYIFTSEGYSGGLTVLLDSEGKPVITPIEK